MGDSKLFRALRAGLRRVAVDRLTTAEDEVERADRLDRLGKNVARRERVASRRAPVGNKDRAIRAAIETFAENVRRLRGAHGNDRHGSAEPILDF